MPGWLEVAIRSMSGIIVLLVLARIFFRKPIGETSFIEFGFMMAIAIILSVGSFQLSLPIGFLLTALFVWAGTAIIISLVSIKSASFRTFIFGKGIPLMKDGKVLEDNMKKYNVTTDELLRKLRAKQVFQFADVEFALLEPNGQLNVLLKKEYQPMTAKLLNKQVAPIKAPETVIMDGKVLDEPLTRRGLNRNWLTSELEKLNAMLENVFLAQIDEYGQLTIDLYDDKIQVPKPVELPLLAANLKKVEADLQLYALDTDDKQAKKMYEWCAKQMKHVYDSVHTYIT